MALEKTEINGGVPIKYWRVSHVIRYNPDAKEAIIGVKGYFDKATRDAGGDHFKIHEFLIANLTRIEQKTRPATLDEKKARLQAAQIEVLTDEQVDEIPMDILLSEEEIPLPYFDAFAAKYEQGKWAEASYDYLNSRAAYINGFFDDAVAV